MNKVDWSKAPEDAEWFAFMDFYKIDDDKIIKYFSECDGVWRKSSQQDLIKHIGSPSYEIKPQQWPESDERVDIIGTNGGDGMHYDEFREEDEAPVLKPMSTYNRHIIGLDGTKTTVDVYRVLDAFRTESAAIDHAVKKLLCAGIRHQKDRRQDLEEAVKSIQAELLLMSQR